MNMHNYLFSLLAAILFLSPLPVLSQNNSIGSWNVINAKMNINAKTSVFVEGQVRSLKFYSNFHYHEIKGGVNYLLNNNSLFTFGAGNYQTYSEEGNFTTPKNNNEIRLWPQITFFQSFGKIKLEQRYRTETRFTSNGYRDRQRIRFGLSFPIWNSETRKTVVQGSVSNEIFLTFREPYFERNRFQFSLNYKSPQPVTYQFGYIKQFDYRINDEIGRDFLVLGIYIDLKK